MSSDAGAQERYRARALINYLPGFIILIFSMVALHATLRLMSEHEALIELYRGQMHVLGEKEDLYDEFESNAQALKTDRAMKGFERWVYWSVVATGICGFMLQVISAARLRSLETANEEKREAMRLLEQRLAALESSLDGICIADHEGRLIYMNVSFMNLFDLLSEDFNAYLGKSWLDLYDADARQKLSEQALQTLQYKDNWQGEIPIRRKDGQVIHTDLALIRMRDGGVITTVRDISDRKAAEQEKQDLQDQFHQSQKMEAIGRLAGGIAHDFNNILAAINGYSEFLVDDLPPGSPQHEFAEGIRQAGNQARSLIDQILAFSRRGQAGDSSINLVQPVSECIPMLKVSFPKTIEIVTHIDAEMVPVRGNVTHISQTLMNLCVNAKDAMEEQHGSLGISLSVVDLHDFPVSEMITAQLPALSETPRTRMQDMGRGRTRLLFSTLAAGRRYARLAVQDTGSGMSRDIMQHIFEPFFTTKSVDKGTGLGLATVHGVIVNHQAAMIVDSSIGQGTTFELLFPLDESAVISVTAGLEQEDHNIIQGRILLVDDQEYIGHMTATMLKRAKYKVDFVTSAVAALEVIRKNPDRFDLVITDHNMPKMTGFEFIGQTHKDFPEMPFIVLSGYSEQVLQEVMQGHPAIKAIIRKPVNQRELARTVRAVLKKALSQKAVV